MSSSSREASRDLLLDRYLSTTYGARNDLTAEGLARKAAVYEREFGAHLPADPEAPILEIGCGGGGFLLACRERGYRRVTGIDLSPELVDFCRGLGFEQVHRQGALEHLSGTAERYELIVMSDVLEHLPRAEVVPVLAAARDRLLPRGRLLLRVPNMGNPLNLRTRYVDFTHESGFTRESLAQLLRAGGFRVVSVEGTFRPHRRWLARLVFDRLLWRLFLLFYRHTLQLRDRPVRGKNLIAVGERPVD